MRSFASTLIALLLSFVLVFAQQSLQKNKELSEVDIRKVLHAHNKYRAHHNAQPLSWNRELVKAASEWSEQCVFAHSESDYGESMAFSRTNNDWEAIVDLWYNEVSSYDFDHPSPYINTSHFTQIVWKDTSSIGCGFSFCPNINYYIYVCEYEPSGNVLAWDGDDENIYFSTNVTKSTYTVLI